MNFTLEGVGGSRNEPHHQFNRMVGLHYAKAYETRTAGQT